MNTTRHHFGAAAAIAAALIALSACGENGLVDKTYQGEPLATVHGSLSIDTPASGQKISIAVAWLNYESHDDPSQSLDFVGDDEGEVACDGTPAPFQTATYRSRGPGLWALQSVAYEATSLVSFQLPIMDLPPEAARMDLSYLQLGDGWMAMGLLIAFLDKDGDGEFDVASPETEGDKLLAVSINESDEYEYEGIVYYLNGTLSDEDWVQEAYSELKQGYNIEVWEAAAEIDEETGEMTGEETVTRDINQTVQLFTPVPMISYEMMDLQCSEVEHIVEFNNPEISEADIEALGCAMGQSEMDDSEGNIEPGPISVMWSGGVADPNNPCVVREIRGFVCFPPNGIPADWQGPCADVTADVPTGVDDTGVTDSSDSGSSDSGSSDSRSAQVSEEG